jgi:nitrate reductase delta subunit
MTHASHPYELLAELFEFPTARALATAERCGLQLSLRNPEATRAVARFASWVAGSELVQIEEEYARTFEAQPGGCLEVGYQLYGDDYRRGLFLMRIQAAAHAHAIAPGDALADHLSSMLRLLARMSIFEDPRTLADESVLPACARLLASLDVRSPYRALLEATCLLLAGDFGVRAIRAVKPHPELPAAEALIHPRPSALPLIELSA